MIFWEGLLAGVILMAIVIALAEYLNRKRHKHDWKAVRIRHYKWVDDYRILGFAEAKDVGSPHTDIYWECSCGKKKTTTEDGYWSLDHFQ